MLRVVIADDEPMALEYLKLTLERVGGVEIVGACANAAECIREVGRTNPDAVFLDIHMPEGTGLDAARTLRGLKSPPQIVFVTGYDDYAVPAFEVAAVDYLMKPFSEERLAQTVARLQQRVSESPRGNESDTLCDIGKLAVKDKNGYKLVDASDICFVQLENRKTRIHTKTTDYFSYNTVTEIAEKLSGFRFFRANEQCLVNLDCVEEVVYYGPGSYELLLSEPRDTFIPLSRSRTRKLREILDF